MTLFNIAIKNIKRNFYNYLIYFTSMVFSIMMYYIFTSIQYNEQVLSKVTHPAQITSIFKTSSVMVAIFAIIFIWYSNSFFTKKRKKEVGLFLLMGVRKRQLGRMLFYENIVMGIIALVTGIFLGSLLSKLFAMLLLKLMGLSVGIKFVVIPKAIIDTVITFLVLFLITSIHGYTIVFRFKLIELFSADKKAEREPKGSIIGAIAAVLLIGFGYGLHLQASIYVEFGSLMTTLITVVLGTYFLFSSLTIFIIKLYKRNRKRYYKGINMIGSSQLLHRIKSSSRTLATIAVLSATTLTAMGVTLSFYYDFIVEVENRNPFSFVYISNTEGLDDKMDEIINKYPQNKLEASIDYELISMEGTFIHSGEKRVMNILSENKFKELVEIRELEGVDLNKSNEAIYIRHSLSTVDKESYKDQKITFDIDNQAKEFNIEHFKDYNLFNSGVGYNILVIKDEVYNKFYDKGEILEGKGYIVKNQKNSKEIAAEIWQLVENENSKDDANRISYRSYYDVFTYGLSINGITIFVGVFLGLVFLLSTGSIIFFKQLSEANEDKIRYDILSKIGVNKKEVRVSISKQMLFVFLLPLLVGITHSLVAVSILQKFFDINLLPPIGLSIGAYTIIYMIYYFLTVNSYTNILDVK